MKILFDTNIVLDVLQAREPHVHLSASLLDQVVAGRLSGLLCATTVTTIAYLTERHFIQHQGKSARQARIESRAAIKTLLNIFDIAPVTRAVIDKAASGLFEDFEDAVLHESAAACGADGIVTRNPGDYTNATLRIYTPPDLTAVLAKAG